MSDSRVLDGEAVLAQLRGWGRELGFSQIGVADIDLASAEAPLLAWLDNGFHGAMDYMASHGLKRARPAELVPGTLSVVTARLDYLPRATAPGVDAAAERYFYFAHTYAAEPADASVVDGVTEYGAERFASAIRQGAIMGVQFHPEKSQREGLALLAGFFRPGGSRS